MAPLKPGLRVFLAQNICSLWTLELLLLLYREPERRWSVDQANRELRATPSLVEAKLLTLERNGLAERSGAHWRFAPRTEELRETVAMISATFAERPFAVVNALFSVTPWRPQRTDPSAR